MGVADFRALVGRSEQGDKEALARLQELLRSGDNADWARLYQDTMGNPAAWLKTTLANMVGTEVQLGLRDAAAEKMDALAKELAGPRPTPIERLLAERAAHCWFQVNVHEISYLQAKDSTLTINQADFQLRRIESAHRRFLSALATLARVRKLALPALQVNQVNVAGPAQVSLGQTG